MVGLGQDLAVQGGGLVQLAKVPAMVARRRELAARYRSALAPLGTTMAADPPWGTTNYQSFWVGLPDGAGRSEVLAELGRRSVSARRGIMASHLEPAYAGQPHRPLPVTEAVTAGTVILPLFHTMTDDEHDHVIASVLDVAQ